jgi:exodeoxyribonuclease-3
MRHVLGMKVATWNINSVRLRRNLVRRVLRDKAPDVLCLQETKTIDELFPRKSFSELGYVHQAIVGQKGYHGVAILSRLPFRETAVERYCDKDDCRHLRATFENGVELHNFYVPAGADIPDPKVNPKFAHKLDFLREMARNFARRSDKSAAKVVIVGDLNVAPLENDVWSHKQLLDVVSHTPVEVGLLGDVKAAFDFTDVTRKFVPENEKIYSWWSYRAQDWLASDRGRRLDHIWVSPALSNQISGHEILKSARGWKQPSDHVPVLATLDV